MPQAYQGGGCPPSRSRPVRLGRRRGPPNENWRRQLTTSSPSERITRCRIADVTASNALDSADDRDRIGSVHDAGPRPPQNEETRTAPLALSDRAALGMLSVLAYMAAEAWLAFASPPVWLAIWFPLPAAFFAANALLPQPIVRPRGRPWLGRLGRTVIAAVVIVGSATVGVGALTQSPTTWDQPLTLTCAARDVLQGRIPYLTYEPQCEKSLHFDGTAATPIAQGAFAHYHRYPPATAVSAQMRIDEMAGQHSGFPAFGYPPLAALLLLPVAYSTWTVINLWVCTLTLVALGLAYLPRPRPPLLLIAWQFAGLGALWYAFGWNPEELAYLALVVAFARFGRAKVSAVALGVAVLTNPISWVIAPVYLAIATYHGEFTTRVRWLAGTIAITLIPWSFWDPALPQQLWTFITLPEFPLGATVASLATLPTALHPLLFIAFLLSIAVCAGAAVRWPPFGWALIPIVILSLLVSWHAPAYYYLAILWLPPAVVLAIPSKSAGTTFQDTVAPIRNVASW